MRKQLELAGRTFGRLTAVRFLRKGKRGVVWRCECSCGTSTTAFASTLACGHKRSCGCLAGENRLGQVEDLSGQVFGDLTVVALEIPETGPRWICECKCGRFTSVMPSGLKKGHAKSCGLCRRPRKNKSWRAEHGAFLARQCRERGLKYDTVYGRVARSGWTIERALSVPTAPLVTPDS